MIRSKIGIIGYGTVGKTTHRVFFPDEQVRIYDIKTDSNIEDLYDCDIIFICISTNDQKDLREIETIVSIFSKNNPTVEIIIRSTITPGFFKTLKGNLTYFPEFLRERVAVKDAETADIMYYATSLEMSFLENYHKFEKKVKRIGFTELEILKLMSNNYRAMKVVFANHFYDLCKRNDADYDLLLKYFYSTRNGQSYMEVGDDLRGYGGKCLPKDIDFAIDIFSDTDLFRAIKNDNKKWKITVRTDQ